MIARREKHGEEDFVYTHPIAASKASEVTSFKSQGMVAIKYCEEDQTKAGEGWCQRSVVRRSVVRRSNKPALDFWLVLLGADCGYC